MRLAFHRKELEKSGTSLQVGIEYDTSTAETANTERLLA